MNANLINDVALMLPPPTGSDTPIEIAIRIIAKVQEYEPTVPRSEYLPVMSMLERRASPEDEALAREKPGHWLHRARRELKDRGIDPFASQSPVPSSMDRKANA